MYTSAVSDVESLLFLRNSLGVQNLSRLTEGCIIRRNMEIMYELLVFTVLFPVLYLISLDINRFVRCMLNINASKL